MKNIKGKTALVTGGSRGLGPYIARALAAEGVNIALCARSAGELHEVAGQLNRFDITAKAYPADVTDADALVKLVEDVKDAFGPLDILVNNAGVERVSAYTDLSPQTIETIVRTNLAAPLQLTRLVLPGMLARASGHVVTLSSLGGKKGSPYSATYAGTKAGLIQWTAGLRAELHATGVGASVICPGFVAQAGMFAAYHKRAPKFTGETTPEKVASAVIRAIQKNVGEIVVNPRVIWPMMMVDAIHPGIMRWVLRKAGVYEFYRQQAEDNLDQSA